MIKKILFSFCTLALFTTAPAQIPDSLDMMVGQMIMIGVPSDEENLPQLYREVEESHLGGVILYEKNIPKKDSYRGLKKLIWEMQRHATIPLLVAIDQEGGYVNRLKEKYGFPPSVSAQYMGKEGMDTTIFYSEIAAATMAGLGINVNFAPVVDLATNPDNPIIARYERAYATTGDSVSYYADMVMKTQERFGVISVLKHFPGHGSSRSDTHLGVADVTPYWVNDEFKPYQELIGRGEVPAVMTAHIVNKTLDQEGVPATLSKPIVRGLLRDSLNFAGVIFSDDMQMHAIAKYYGLKEAIKLSIQAGIDILIFSNNIVNSEERTVETVRRIIKGLIVEGEIPEERIKRSYRRIIDLKNRYLEN